MNNGNVNYLEKEIVSSGINVTQKYNLKYFNIMNLNNDLYDNENDNSIINYVTFLRYKFLFMGDASTKVEEKLLNEYDLTNINFLKVGHHGSKTSSSKEFINEINPNYSIISVGKNNRYGHPNKEVLNNLRNSEILRTDLMGTISIKIRKKRMRINYMVK